MIIRVMENETWTSRPVKPFDALGAVFEVSRAHQVVKVMTPQTCDGGVCLTYEEIECLAEFARKAKENFSEKGNIWKKKVLIEDVSEE